jgi:hypothetical protein
MILVCVCVCVRERERERTRRQRDGCAISNMDREIDRQHVEGAYN